MLISLRMAQLLSHYLDALSRNGNLEESAEFALQTCHFRLKTRILAGKVIVKPDSKDLNSALKLLQRTIQPLQSSPAGDISATEQIPSSRQADSLLFQQQRSTSFVRGMRIRKKAEYESAYARIQRKITTSLEEETHKQAKMTQKLQDFHDAELRKLQAKIASHKSLTPTPRTVAKVRIEPRNSPNPVLLPKERLSSDLLKRHETAYLLLKRTKDTLRGQVFTERVAELRQQGADLTPPDTPKAEKRTKEMKLQQERRHRYGAIIRDLFCPAVDQRLKAARESIIADMSTSKCRRMEPEPGSCKPPVPIVPTNARKPKPVLSCPATQRHRDYLAELRQERPLLTVADWKQSFALSFDSKRLEAGRREWICTEANRLISLTARREQVLKAVPLTDPLALEAREHLSETLLTAVKAKLSLLQAETFP